MPKKDQALEHGLRVNIGPAIRLRFRKDKRGKTYMTITAPPEIKIDTYRSLAARKVNHKTAADQEAKTLDETAGNPQKYH